MAEAVAAVGLAAGVLQFVDVGTRFVNNARKIYQSGRENAGHMADLEKTTNDLQIVLAQLQVSEHKTNDEANNDSSFLQLVSNCQQLADELLSSVQSISIPPKSSKRDAFKAAFKMIWKEENCKSLEARLDAFRQELMIHLLALIRRQGQQSIERQAEILAQLKAMHPGRHLDKEFAQGIGSVVLQVLSDSEFRSGDRPTESQQLRSSLIKTIYKDARHEREVHPHPSIAPERRQWLYQGFLRLFSYSDMNDREDRIAEAYESTFQWIFDGDHTKVTEWSDFREWLESDSQLYWITGKAGSGKSTLMKYICQENTDKAEPLCAKFLRKWAGTSRLLMAHFFFWNSGNQVQMSQKGLLCTLLHQILKVAPDMIPKVAAERWEALCLFGELSDDSLRDLTVNELFEMLCAAARETSEALCLFIDGLDEFEGQHDDLIRLVKILIGSSNIKICVSSRPWVIFEDAFEKQPSLMLQDLTYSDIKHYVTTQFNSNNGFAQLRRAERKYADQLIENVVSKASGVFLWVNIVVASLLAGMDNRDRVQDLQRRLDLLPPDLEKLYDKILGSVDPFYLEHAAQYFQTSSSVL